MKNIINAIMTEAIMTMIALLINCFLVGQDVL